MYNKKLLFLVFLSFNINEMLLLRCPLLKCNRLETQFVNQTCFSYFYDNDGIQNIELSTCIKGQYCNIPKLNIKEIIKIKDTIKCSNYSLGYWSSLNPGNLVENDYCYLGIDCESNNCINNLCVGKLDGDSCVFDSQCQSNSYCNKNVHKCEKKLKIGDQCISNKMCPSGSGCLYGVCVAYNSLPDGTKVSNKYLNVFCESGYLNSDGVCEGLLNSGTPPYLCDDKNSCSYMTTITKTIITRDTCLCDLSGRGTSYCMLSTKSSQYKSFVKAKYELIQSSNSCDDLHTSGCINTNEDHYENFLEKYLDVYQSLNNFTSEIIPCLNREVPLINPTKCSVLPCDDSLLKDNQQGFFTTTSGSLFKEISYFVLIILNIMLIL